jgi:hypothetical protein
MACSQVPQILPERTTKTRPYLNQGIESLDQESDPGLPNTKHEGKDIVLRSQSTPSQLILSIAFDTFIFKVVCQISGLKFYIHFTCFSRALHAPPTSSSIYQNIII